MTVSCLYVICLSCHSLDIFVSTIIFPWECTMSINFLVFVWLLESDVGTNTLHLLNESKLFLNKLYF